ncbi:Regulator of nonsense transcripts 1-like protein [Tritrichomonas musculus]|uniref:Regulator of nonsense transcripts 1-like protein n=1 Tax=Tritrichomonas musculus TaxID=1915356 RepID=A0ABR2ICM0_9EUKA
MPPKRGQKGKKTKRIDPDEEPIDQAPEEEKAAQTPSSTKRVEINLDPKYHVPLCYVKFFEKKKGPENNNEQHVQFSLPPGAPMKDIIFKIEVDKKKGKKTSTTVSWDPKKKTLTKDQINDLKSLQKEFGTNCTVEKDSIVFFGTFDEELKVYLVEHFDVKDDQISVKIPKPEVPNFFNITIIVKDGSDFTKVKWNPKTWKNATYKQFVDEFRAAIVEELQLPEPEEFERKANHIFTIQGTQITNNLIEYFTKTWSIDPKQINVQTKSVDKEPLISPEIDQPHIKNPLRKMSRFFSDFDTFSYYKRMADTIEASYSYEKERLENFEIKTNLNFIKSGSDGGSDKDGKNAWVTSFSVLNAVSIDGIASGRFLSEGDTVLIRYMHRRRPLRGSILEIKRGKVTALFKIKYRRVPPGCKPNAQEKEEEDCSESDSDFEENDEETVKKKENEEEEEGDEKSNENTKNKEEEDADDDDYDDYNDDDEEEEENNEEEEDLKKIDNDINDINKNPYTIKFLPSDSVYQRCALALLNLYEMHNSPIKKIISGEQVNASSNKSNNEVINDASFDLTDSSYLDEEDRQNPSFMKFLKLEATISQTRCVEMILQNCISIVHGPPGCGKTSSISLFVYHLLKKAVSEKKRILLCAFSNQAVENIARFVSPIIKALGKKMVWIPRKSVDFETKKNFDEASEEEKNLSIYKILTRNTKECQKFKKLQEIKWELNLKMKEYRKAKKEKRYYPEGKPRRFSVNEQNQMNELRSLIEQSLVSESDVVCSTLVSSAKMNIVNFKFEYVFIDEASQANQTVSIIPLIHHPSKIVLLGDHKQLDAMVPDKLKGKFNDTMQSLYRKLLKNKVQHEMLNVQFRMNPLIAQFPNQEFYKNRIINAPGIYEKTFVELQSIPTPIAFIDVKKGKEKKVFGTSYRNIKEAEVVERLVNNFKKNRISSKDLGVITPYHGQVHILRKKIEKLDYPGLRISSVDTFQGSERDFIILSLVRTNKLGKFGFLPDKHRINVSLTRARKGLIIVGNFSAILNSNQNGMNSENQFLVDLCNFYSENNAVFDESQIDRIKIFVEKVKKTKLSITTIPKIEKSENTKDDDNAVEDNTNNNNSSHSNSVDVDQLIESADYDVDSDYDENAINADDITFYKAK